MKRIYTFLLLSLFVWSTAMAEVFSGTCGANGDNLTWTLDTETGALVISGEGEMKDFKQVNSPWYSYRSDITSVDIADGVTTIGNFAFADCSRLTSITIPNSVTTIENEAFSGCSSLISLTIPNSVTTIDSVAFDGCSSLTSLTIPNSVTTIGDGAFRSCSGLTSISVAADNLYYDSRNDCNAIIETASNTLVAGCKNTVIPNSVTTIGEEAFYYCSSLTSLTIPNSVTTIENYTFTGCSSLTSLTIPNSVTTIGNFAFSVCSSLTSISVAADNPYYDSRNDCNAIIETASNTLIKGCRNTVIPNTVTAIGLGAFSYCSGLTSLTIPNSVTTIGDYAFSSCSDLISLTIPNSVTAIGNDVFSWYCSSLTSITMESTTPPNTYGYPFQGPNALSTIYVPAGAAANYDVAPWNSYEIIESIFTSEGIVYSIESDSTVAIKTTDNTFCPSHTFVYELPNQVSPNGVKYYKVTSIRDSAFYECETIPPLVDIPNSIISIGHYAFANAVLKQISIPSSVTSIALTSFRGCNQLQYIHIDEQNPIYDSRENCRAIIETASNTLLIGCKKSSIPNSITKIGVFAFSNVHGLSSLEIPNSVISIERFAFNDCTNLGSIVIPNSVVDLGDGIFWCCTNLETATIGDSVKEIPYNAFWYCPKLSQIKLGKSVQKINTQAFLNCGAIKTIIIPASIESIESSAFTVCDSLESIIIHSTTPPNTDIDAFDRCNALNTIYVPVGAAANYDVAPWNSYNIVEMSTKVQVDNLWYNLDFENQTAEVTNSGTIGEYSGSIVIPGSISAYGETFVVTAIGQSAFRDCSGLTSLTIPNSVTEIGDHAFYYCSGLTSLTIPSSVTEIREGAIEGCSGLTSLTIPNSVTEIESYAFSHCSNLTNIAIPNSVTSLERSTFAYCTALDSIYIPSSVSEIDIWVFAHCDALEKIIVDPNNSKYDSRENCNGIVESETNALIIGCKTTTIPSDVTSIADYAFDDCTLLTSLTIPSSVTNIGAEAFANCSGLTSLSMLSATPPSTGSNVFKNCNALAAIYIPEGAAVNYDVAPWNNYFIIEPSFFSKFYRIKNIETGLYLNASNYDIHEEGPKGGVNAISKVNSDDQVFAIIANGNKFKLRSISRKYIYCQNWNVDALDISTALTFVPTGEGVFHIMRDRQYFKMEEVEGVYYPFCDANLGTAAKFMLEEVDYSVELPLPEEPIIPTTIDVDELNSSKKLVTITIKGISKTYNDWFCGNKSSEEETTEILWMWEPAADSTHYLKKKYPTQAQGEGYLQIGASGSNLSFGAKSTAQVFIAVQGILPGGHDTPAIGSDTTTNKIVRFSVKDGSYWINIGGASGISGDPTYDIGQGLWTMYNVYKHFEEDLSQQMDSLIAESKEALEKTGIGYPTAESIERLNLQNVLKEATPSLDTRLELATALNEYYATTNIVLPEAGKYYSFTMVNNKGDKYYLNYTGEDIAIVPRTNEKLPTSAFFLAGLNADSTAYTFQTLDNNYLVHHTDYQGENTNGDSRTGFQSNQDEKINITLAKMQQGSYVNGSNKDIFGLLTWYSLRKIGGKYGYTVLKSNGSDYDGANSPYWNDSYSSGFLVEEGALFSLTDGKEYTQATEVETERITYTRNFKNTYYQPWYVPFDVEYDEIIDRFVVAELNDIHQFDDNNDGEFERWAIEVLQLKSGDVISANHPYMIKARTTGEQSIVVENTTLYPAVLNTIDCSSTKMLYTFEPTYTTLSGSVLREEGCYVVGSGKLVMPTDGSVVKANRWYLRPEPRNGGSLLSAPKQIQIFERDENGLTDIETAIEESEQTTWPADVYNLNGRLVRKAATNMDGLNKGMYIVNGKKIVK